MRIVANLLVMASLVLGQMFGPSHSYQATDATPTPTDISTPTTPVDTATPEITDTPVPSDTPTDISTPNVTDTPFDTATPDVTDTPTPDITDTPTEIATETVTPGITDTPSVTDTPTVTPSVTPTVNPVSLTLSIALRDKTSRPGKRTTINWSVAGLSEVTSTMVLQFTLPDGYIPQDKQGTFDPTTRIFSMPVKTLQGKFSIRNNNDLDNKSLQATLLDGTNQITTTTFALPIQPRTKIGTNGGDVTAESGRIRVHFPSKVFSNDAYVFENTPDTDALPAGAASDTAFEVKAYDKTSHDELNHFSDQIQLNISYDPSTLDGSEQDLKLVYYNTTTAEWEALPSHVDTVSHTVTGYTTHFSVFDIDASSWQANHIPTVDAFQVSDFTGAATYSYPIELPAGPGGLQPSLELSYNSQVIDQAIYSSMNKTQASWVGMGWSLETGSIERNTRGTDTITTDDSFFLNVPGSGVSVGFTKDNGVYHTTDENYWKITYDATADTWTVWDKLGNSYLFGNAVQSYIALGCKTDNSAEYQATSYLWVLKSITNIYGKALTYDYSTETKTFKYDHYTNSNNKCLQLNQSITVTTAIYPSTITYPDKNTRVRFVRTSRTDYPASWVNDVYYHEFQRSRLNSIIVERDADNDADHTFESIIRQYVLTYALDQGFDYVKPVVSSVTFGAGGKVSTLYEIQEFGVGGSALGSHLPATTFAYGDFLHLTHADNGYGGSVDYDYSVWYYSAKVPKSHTRTYDYTRCGQQGHFTDPWTGGVVVECAGNLTTDFVGIRAIPTSPAVDNNSDMIRPGGVYRLTLTYLGTTPTIWLDYGTGGKSSTYSPVTSTGYIFSAPGNASYVRPMINTNDLTTYVTNYKLELLTSVYWVKSKTINDGSTTNNKYITQYQLSGGSVNNDTNTERDANGTLMNCADSTLTVQPPAKYPTCYQVVEKYSEFRGFGTATVTNPDGTKTITSFNQGDFLKGRPISVKKMAGSKVLSRTDYEYKSSILGDGNLVGPGNVAYQGDERYAVVKTSETNYVDESTTPNTSTTFTYGSYGNLTEMSEYEGDFNNNGTLYRKTAYSYFAPNTAPNYIKGLLATQAVWQGSTLVSKTINLYETTTVPGQLNAVQTLVSGTNYSQVSYEYDTTGWGNKTSETHYTGFTVANSTTPPSGPQTTLTGYEAYYHTYPVTIKNALGQMTRIGYDYLRDVPNCVSGLIMQWRDCGTSSNDTLGTYDDFGRLTGVIRPGDSDLIKTIIITYHDGPSFSTDFQQLIDGSRYYKVTRTYDGLGRQTQIKSGDSIVDTIYDNSSTVTMQSMPHKSGETAKYVTTTVYPALRQTVVQNPDGSSVTTTMTNSFTTKVQDANGTTTSVKDVWGRTTSVTPPTGSDLALSYTYDVVGNLLTVTRGTTLITQYSYDRVGRKTGMDDLNLGWSNTGWGWTYRYDGAGNLIEQKDAKSQHVCLYYDDLNRVTGKYYNSSLCPSTDPGNDAVTYSYDEQTYSGIYGLGRRTSMTDNSGNTYWTYDERGNITSEVKKIGKNDNSPIFKTSWDYNSANLVTSITYPGGSTGQAGELVTTHYNNQMLADTLTGGTDSYVTASTYDASSRLTSRTLNNTLTQTYGYYTWDGKATPTDTTHTGSGGRLQTITTGSIQSLAYKYYETGNIYTTTDTISSETSTYEYDSLNRLTKWTLDPSGYSESYLYDSLGNLSNKAGTTLTYGGSHPNAVMTAGNNSYDYDNNGNQTTRTINGTIYTLGYDTENRLASVSGGTTSASFTYDGDGKRVQSTINGTTTTFIGNYYEWDGSHNTNYYYISGTRVAMRKYIIPQNPTINYFLGDNLGSTSVTADANGAAVSTIHYKPWGEIRTPLDSTTNLPYNPGPSNYTYTGQYSNMDDFGLMFYNARWYDPGISQFASPDTMIPNTYNPLDWNRYSYADYNPINRTDPSGHCYKLGKGTMTDDECEAGHESGYLTYEKHIKPYQDNRKRASVGMYCDEQRCWTDSATDISGTLQDPAVYISVSISCFGTGFCAALTSSITQFGWAACAASQTCLNLAKGYGIYYPPNNGYANGYTFQDFAEGQVLQHWGTDEGAFMSDAGTSASELSLPPDKWGTEPTYYRVVTPFGANTGGVASYYGLQGGGVQYVLGRSIEDYLAMNLLEKILH